MNIKNPCPGFDLDTFRSESVARAVAAWQATCVGQYIDISDYNFTPESAYTIGLFSQIGRLAFAVVCPDEYADILKNVDEIDPYDLARREKELFKIDHNQLGARMVADWDLPEIFSQAILYQDTSVDELKIPADSPTYQLIDLIQWTGKTLRFCTTISNILNRPESRTNRDYLDKTIAEAEDINISSDEFPLTFDLITDEWKQLNGALDIPLPEALPTDWKKIYSLAG